MPHQERVNIAVFIDFDNIEIGVKNTLHEHFDIGTILEALKERGEVVTKIAYADWTRAGEYSRALTQHAIRLVQRNLTPGGDKNGADINLALDALEMAFTHPHINAYVIVGGDSDFLSLVEKLKQYDKKVFVVGGRAFTSVILQRNCHEFIAYENLVRRPAPRGGKPTVQAAASPLAQAFPLVRRALKILADREVSPQTGLLKSTLLQLDSTFSERNYGATSFLDFAEKLAQAGLVQLKHAGRSVMVELNPAFEDGDSATTAAVPDAKPRLEEAKPVEGQPAAPVVADQRPPVEVIGGSAEGAQVIGGILRSATTARWPMYLRNFKQLLRAAQFDERSYGFGGLMDLLRACERESLIRVERDRRRGLRLFPGSALGPVGVARSRPPQGDQHRLGAPAHAAAPLDPEAADNIGNTIDAPAAGHVADVSEADVEAADAQPPMVVDTTAELLGRAKARRPRTRAVAAATPRKTSSSSARKPSAGRKTTTRTRKTTSNDE
ncbi:MAG TPA: NYN domain-containing protein [Vicinamibacterales bacterium]|nr:NYN domain-containing protein [Vicinamibacterales bacterium]